MTWHTSWSGDVQEVVDGKLADAFHEKLGDRNAMEQAQGSACAGFVESVLIESEAGEKDRVTVSASGHADVAGGPLSVYVSISTKTETPIAAATRAATEMTPEPVAEVEDE